MPSEKILNKKKQVVADLVEDLKDAQTIVFIDYRGVSVEQDTELRSEMRKEGIVYKVIKNSIVSLAMKECKIEVDEETFKGPTAIAFSKDDLVAPARVSKQIAKKFSKFEIKSGVIEGNHVSKEEIEKVASLPTKEILVSKVLGGLNAPISGFVYVLNANMAGLARVLNAISEQKQ